MNKECVLCGYGPIEDGRICSRCHSMSHYEKTVCKHLNDISMGIFKLLRLLDK